MTNPIKLILAGNNRNGYRVSEWLLRRGESIVAAVLHPDDRAKYKSEMKRVLPADVLVVEGNQVNSPEAIQRLSDLRPDLLISVNFGYVLKEPVLRMPRLGCFNLHTGYLPYNRGAHPNVWAIVDQTPAGVSIHKMDSGIDTGPIVARAEIAVSIADTGKTLQERLEDAALDLFIRSWEKLRLGELELIKVTDEGSFHRVRDVREIDTIDLERRYKARDLINILRARTYPPYRNAYFEWDGRKYYLQIEIIPEPLAPGKVE